MSTLEFANKFFLQWFFIRLTRCSRRVITDAKFYECSLLSGNRIAAGYSDIKYGIEYWYSIQGWIIPTTGWNNDFKHLGAGWSKIVSKPVTIDDKRTGT